MRSITIAFDWITHLHRGCSDRSTILLMDAWSIPLGVKTSKWPSLCEMGPHFSRRFSDRSRFFITKVTIDHYSHWLNYTSTQKLQWSIEHFFNGSAFDPLGVKTCKWHLLCEMGPHLFRGYSNRSHFCRTKCVIN